MVVNIYQPTMVRFRAVARGLAISKSCRMPGVQLARNEGARASSTVRAVARASCEVKSEVEHL